MSYNIKRGKSTFVSLFKEEKLILHGELPTVEVIKTVAMSADLLEADRCPGHATNEKER